MLCKRSPDLCLMRSQCFTLLRFPKTCLTAILSFGEQRARFANSFTKVGASGTRSCINSHASRLCYETLIVHCANYEREKCVVCLFVRHAYTVYGSFSSLVLLLLLLLTLFEFLKIISGKTLSFCYHLARLWHTVIYVIEVKLWSNSISILKEE